MAHNFISGNLINVCVHISMVCYGMAIWEAFSWHVIQSLKLWSIIIGPKIFWSRVLEFHGIHILLRKKTFLVWQSYTTWGCLLKMTTTTDKTKQKLQPYEAAFSCMLVTDRSSVLPFYPNRTEQVNQSSVSRTETEQNRTCKKRIKT